jgi:hypothetical protein
LDRQLAINEYHSAGLLAIPTYCTGSLLALPTWAGHLLADNSSTAWMEARPPNIDQLIAGHSALLD